MKPLLNNCFFNFVKFPRASDRVVQTAMSDEASKTIECRPAVFLVFGVLEFFVAFFFLCLDFDHCPWQERSMMVFEASCLGVCSFLFEWLKLPV